MCNISTRVCPGFNLIFITYNLSRLRPLSIYSNLPTREHCNLKTFYRAKRKYVCVVQCSLPNIYPYSVHTRTNLTLYVKGALFLVIPTCIYNTMSASCTHKPPLHGHTQCTDDERLHQNNL